MHAPRPAARARPGRTSLAPARVPSGTVYPLYARICLSARCAWSSVSDPGPCCLLVLPRHHPASSVCSASAPASLFLTLRIRIRTPTVHLRNKPSPRHAIVISISNVHLHVILEARRSRPARVEESSVRAAPAALQEFRKNVRAKQPHRYQASRSSTARQPLQHVFPSDERDTHRNSHGNAYARARARMPILRRAGLKIQTSERPPCQRAVTPAESDADAHTE